MTSIVNVNMTQNLVAQVKWKCKVYSSMFSTVIIVHLLFGLLTFSSGSVNSGGSRGFLEYQALVFSLDFVFIISIFMLFILGWSLAAKALTVQSYSLVNTNKTETISSLLFLVLLVGFTFLSAISTVYITFFIQLLTDHDSLQFMNLSIDVQVIYIFFAVTLLAGSVGYFLKSLFEYSKMAFSVIVVGFVVSINSLSDDVYMFLFGEGYLTIGSRSLLYVLLLWGLTLICRQQSEVIRR